MILKMLFLTFTNINIYFAKKKLILKSYIVAKTLFTIKQIDVIDKKKFAKAVLDEESKIFIIYIATF